MATEAEIMEAIAGQLRTALAEVEVPVDVAIQVEPLWVVNPTPPCVDIYPGDPSSDQDLRGFRDVVGEPVFTVRARIDIADSAEAQLLLLALMDGSGEDPLSVAAALHADKTLGGVVTSLDVRSRSGYVRVLEGGDFIGCLWQVVVMR